jgi:hypothetical protein
LVLSVPNRDWLKYDRYIVRHTPFQPVEDHWYRVAELRELLTSVGLQVTERHGAEKLYFGGGLMHLLERVALALSQHLRERMKRLIIIAMSPSGPPSVMISHTSTARLHVDMWNCPLF